MTIQAIETRYAGCRFRSRLEARWAVFFNVAGIPWEYEPEGFIIGGRHYLPDFRLPESGTWIEVKGRIAAKEVEFFGEAGSELPAHRMGGEPCQGLMVVGPIPQVPEREYDIGWALFSRDPWDEDHSVHSLTYGFGRYHKNHRPWWLPADPPSPPSHVVDDTETMDSEISNAYRAARSARFEHGEVGV